MKLLVGLALFCALLASAAAADTAVAFFSLHVGAAVAPSTIIFPAPSAAYIYPAAPATPLVNLTATVTAGTFAAGGGTFSSSNCAAQDILVSPNGNVQVAGPSNLTGSKSCTVTAAYPGAVSVSQTLSVIGTQQTIASVLPCPFPSQQTGPGCQYNFAAEATTQVLGAVPTPMTSGGISFADGSGTIGLGVGSQCSSFSVSGGSLMITAPTAGEYDCTYVITDSSAVSVSPVPIVAIATAAAGPLTIAVSPSTITLSCNAAPGTIAAFLSASGGNGAAITYSMSGSDASWTINGLNQVVVASGGIISGDCTSAPISYTMSAIQSGSTTSTATLAITASPPSSLTVANQIVVSGAAAQSQTNYPMQFGRPFIDGAIPHSPQVLINGVPAAYSQADVKNRYPDGSVEFAVISTIIPAVSASDCSISNTNPTEMPAYALWTAHNNLPVFNVPPNPTQDPLQNVLYSTNCHHLDGNGARTMISTENTTRSSNVGGQAGFTEEPPYPAPSGTRGVMFSAFVCNGVSWCPTLSVGCDEEFGCLWGPITPTASGDAVEVVTAAGGGTNSPTLIYFNGGLVTPNPAWPPPPPSSTTPTEPYKTQGTLTWGADGDHVPAFETGVIISDQIFTTDTMPGATVGAVSAAINAFYGTPGSASPIECGMTNVHCSVALSTTHRMVAGATKAFMLYNVSGKTTQDIGFDSHGAADVAAALTFCGSVANCRYQTIYDQTAEGVPGPTTITFQDNPGSISLETSYVAIGDSITYGQFASPLTLGYPYLIAADNNLSLTNRGIPSEYTCQAGNDEVFPFYAPQATDKTLYSILLGTNDAAFEGTGPNEALYENCLMAEAAWLSIPNTSKVYAQAATAAGRWVADNTDFVSGIAEKIPSAGAAGSTLSFPITVSGGSAYIWYSYNFAGGAAFSYAVDGGGATTVTPTCSFDCAQPNTGIVRITGLTNTSHTVLITDTAGQPIVIAAVGTVPTSGQRVLVGGVLQQLNDTQSAATAAYNADSLGVSSTLAADGLNVAGITVRSPGTGNPPTPNFVCDTSTCMFNQYHPNNLGHRDLANAFESVVPNNTPQSLASMQALLPPGTTTLTLTPNTGSATSSPDAATMLAAGNYSLWTSGPVAQTIMLADDSATAAYDVGFGDGYKPFRPRYYATFWPALNKVFVRLVGENGNSTQQEDLKYKIAVADGYAADLSGTQATNNKFHWVNSRWTHTFWVGGAAPIQSVNIDEGLAYLDSTRFLPNLDATIVLPLRSTTAGYLSWQSAPHDIYDGYWDASGNTGWWNWLSAMGTAGNSYHIGPYPLSEMYWLHSADWRYRTVALNMVDLAASWPIDIREGSTTRIFQRGDTPNSGTGLGRVISAAGRPLLNAYTGAPDNLTNVGAITAGPWTADDAHQPSVYFPAYVLTGDPWYLDMLYAWGGWTVFEDAGTTYYDCTTQTSNCSIFRGPSGAYGGMYGSKAPRAIAWTLRGRAETAFAAPDGVPEKNYFRYMTNDAIAKWEGGAGITGTAFDTATTKVWVKLTDFPYVWDSWGGPTPGLSGQYPPLGNMASGFCTPPTTLVTCGVPLTSQQNEYGLVPGANGTIDNGWMNFYLEYAIGRAVELGFPMSQIQAISDSYPIGIISSAHPAFLNSYGIGPEKQGGGFWASWAAYYAGGADPTYVANLDSGLAASLSPGAYVTQVAPALATAVDDSVSGAVAAWAWYNTNVYSILSGNGSNASDPRWAIVPRTDSNVLPAQSTATPP